MEMENASEDGPLSMDVNVSKTFRFAVDFVFIATSSSSPHSIRHFSKQIQFGQMQKRKETLNFNLNAELQPM